MTRRWIANGLRQETHRFTFPRRVCKAHAVTAATGRGDDIEKYSLNEEIMSASDEGFQIALEEAKKGASEGGVPIGACIVDKDGKVLGRGHNMRIQKSSATLHGEISALENAGRLPASAYRGATMYTTLSPCDMCTGACILYKVGRVVMGENDTFVGGEEHLKRRGIEVINLDNAECKGLMRTFMNEHPDEWNEDIGERSKSA